MSEQTYQKVRTRASEEWYTDATDYSKVPVNHPSFGKYACRECREPYAKSSYKKCRLCEEKDLLSKLAAKIEDRAKRLSLCDWLAPYSLLQAWKMGI